MRMFLRSYEQAWYEMLREATHSVANTDTVINLIAGAGINLTEHAGPIRNVRGSAPQDTQQIRVPMTAQLNIKDIRAANIDAHTSLVHKMGEELKAGIVPQILDEFSKSTLATGNTVDAQGKELSWDTFIDAVDKIDLGFDANDEPIQPRLVMHPNSAARFKEIAMTLEQEERLQKIMQAKKEAYIAAKRTRRLS